MNRLSAAGIVLLIFGIASSFTPEAFLHMSPEPWPIPVYDYSKNPPTQAGIALGRKLFYDQQMSKDGSISCGSCHLSFTAFTHVDHALSHGIGDSVGIRNAPALMNLAWNTSFMWDGAINHLDMQALAPIHDPREMGEDIAHVIEKLQKTDDYPRLFDRAFGDSILTGEHLLKALAQFQLTLISANSKYDQVMRAEEGIHFTSQEERGYELFKSNCASCHREPLFTTGEFANNGLPVDTTLNDVGRLGVTGNQQDSLKFKIPTLRNIEFSYPYMHDGRFKKLSHVINHYVNGIVHGPTLAPALKNKIELNSEDRADIIAFLLTLTDREFLFNPDHAYPR
jgi:cytochrome c peroxidase